MHTLSETPAWFSRILGMFPKTSLMMDIVGYFGSLRVQVVALQGWDSNCNQDWSSSFNYDRWWIKRVWTLWWIEMIWEPRIWCSCWFYCCFSGLTVFLFPILYATFTSTLLAEQGAQHSLMQRAQTFSYPFWALPSLSDVSISHDKSWCQSMLDDIAPL